VPQKSIGDLLMLKTTIFNLSNEIRPWVIRIAEVLGELPEDLAPSQHHREALQQSEFTAQVTADQLIQLTRKSDGDPSVYLEFLEAEEKDPFERMIESLPDRQKVVLRMRMVDGKTLDQCANDLGISGPRVRQIEEKALRFLRHPERMQKALDAAGPYSDNINRSFLLD
jgi:RNA polymerase sigma factor (sigma-70 family)